MHLDFLNFTALFKMMIPPWWKMLINWKKSIFIGSILAMVIKEFNIQMLKRPLNQERYKILLIIYFLIPYFF